MSSDAAARTRPIVEAHLEEQWREPGEHLGCVTTPFGVDPADASVIDQVEIVYAHALCVSVLRGRPYEISPSGVYPIAVRSQTEKIDLACEGSHYNKDLCDIFPARLRDQVSAGMSNGQAAETEVRELYDSDPDR